MTELRNKGQHGLLATFLYEQKLADPSKTETWWAKRWGVSQSLVNHWKSGRKRIGVNHLNVFRDLPFTVEQYYQLTPKSDRLQRRRFSKNSEKKTASGGKKR